MMNRSAVRNSGLGMRLGGRTPVWCVGSPGFEPQRHIKPQDKALSFESGAHTQITLVKYGKNSTEGRTRRRKAPAEPKTLCMHYVK